jgi:2,3-bisphosphoglycerate-dependent phosphoglycerate mutase
MALLVLLRHGESLWNQKNVFTGWVDIPLSEKGIEEAIKAGEILSECSFDFIYVSTLVRSMETALLVMTKNNSAKVPVVMHEGNDQAAQWSRIYNPDIEANTIPLYQDWHLNERYYGELQGKNKLETANIYGVEQVHIWRRSYDNPPPEGEALKDTAERTIPFFKSNIIPLLEKRKNILISAHGNSLRSIVMHIEGISKDEILKLEIATGIPLFYNFSNGSFTRAKKP